MLTMFSNKREFNNSDCDIALLPIGALEQHGSHLPIGTDALIAEKLGYQVAKKLNGYLLPTIAIANSIEHRKFKGTVSISPETLSYIIKDIATSLEFSGFKKMIIINRHGANWIIKPTVRGLNRELQEIDIILISPDIGNGRCGKILQHVNNDIHAGEKETSLMLYLFKEYIGEIKLNDDHNYLPQSFLDYFDISDLTADGYWGYPEDATEDKGQKLFHLMLEETLNYISLIEKIRKKLAKEIK